MIDTAELRRQAETTKYLYTDTEPPCAVDNMLMHEWVETINPAAVIELLDRLDAAESDKVVTCVYCGMGYPQGTPTNGATVLTEHIKVCPKHPMRELEARLDKAEKVCEATRGYLNHSGHTKKCHYVITDFDGKCDCGYREVQRAVNEWKESTP